MITWALVPLTPKEEMPARRGLPLRGQGVVSVRRLTLPADQSTCDEGSVTCSVGGRVSWRSASTILMTPATPAAAWVWPMLDLTAPSRSGVARSWP